MGIWIGSNFSLFERASVNILGHFSDYFCRIIFEIEFLGQRMWTLSLVVDIAKSHSKRLCQFMHPLAVCESASKKCLLKDKIPIVKPWNTFQIITENSSSCGIRCERPKRTERSWETWELNVLKGDILINGKGMVYLINGAAVIGWPHGSLQNLTPNSHLIKKGNYGWSKL